MLLDNKIVISWKTLYLVWPGMEFADINFSLLEAFRRHSNGKVTTLQDFFCFKARISATESCHLAHVWFYLEFLIPFAKRTSFTLQA